MTTTVVQVSDTHLSGRHGYFLANWRRMLRRLRAEPPDLVVNTGDLSINGAEDDDDLAFAIEEHRRLPVPWRVVCGNHDIGEEPGALHLGHPIGDDRLDRWTRIAGEQWWSVDVESWRLVGLNGFLYGTGMAIEREQHDWLRHTLATAPGPIGVFVHKPLFVDGPDDPGGVRAFTASNRRPLVELLRSNDVRFVACGHLHQHRQAEWEGRTLIWGPSTAFPAGEAAEGASTALGWVEHVFDGDQHRATLVELPELERIELASLKEHGRYEFLYQTPPAPPDLGYLIDA